MPDLLIELFSEEIPARMQTRAAEDLKARMTNGLVEHQMSQVTWMAKDLMQTETDKFRASISLMQDYYTSIENNLVPDPAETTDHHLVPVNEEGEVIEEELPPVMETVEGEENSEEKYPRLDRFYAGALET